MPINLIDMRSGLPKVYLNSGHSGQNSSPRPESAFRGVPPLAARKAAGTLRKVPEFRPEAGIPPLVPSPLFGGAGHILLNLLRPPVGAADSRLQGSPPAPPRPESAFPSVFLIPRVELLRNCQLWQFRPTVGREACGTDKTPRKVKAGGDHEKRSQKAPDDAISGKLLFRLLGAGTSQNRNKPDPFLGGRHAKRSKSGENERKRAKRALSAEPGTFRLL